MQPDTGRDQRLVHRTLILAGSVLVALFAGCYYDVEPANVDLGDIDLSVPGPADFSFADALVCPNGSAPRHAGELAEAPIDEWGAQAIASSTDGGTLDPSTTVTLDTTRVAAGSASLRLDTTEQQAGLVYPKSRDAAYDLTQQLYVSFSLTADDSAAANDPGWQGAQPHLLVVSGPDDYFEYVPDDNRVPRTPGDFVPMTVPLAGGSGWTRNQFGTPDLSSVRYLAWTFDTWGHGFTVWLDDVQVGPSPFYDCGG